jgi:predicted O-linked N-acetylglucosamine transferase (SPINDLY family)
MRAQQGRNDEALVLMEDALREERHDANLLANYGNLLNSLRRSDEALASFDAALDIDPANLVALYGRGQLFHRLKQYKEALTSYDRLLAGRPDHAEAWTNRGNILRLLKRPLEALDSYHKALALRPNDAVALTNRGNAFGDLKQFDEALTSYNRALAIKPDYLMALYNSGTSAQRAGRSAQALEIFERVLSANPGHPYALGHAANAALKLCDWPNMRRIAHQMEHPSEHSIIPPFVALGYGSDAAALHGYAQAYMRDKVPTTPSPLWTGRHYEHDRIRLGYISGDFRQHAVAYQMVEVFERHDRRRFEVLGFSLGHDDCSDIRRRVAGAFDQFHDLRSTSDLDAAQLMRNAEIDIAIDLSGLTRDARPEILAHRPAPVQVNYIGFAGTMGADFIDYVIGDSIALPFDQQPFFTEQIVHLPGCFLANSAKGLADSGFTRRDAGLPQRGFVFCCFNNSWKITEPLFDIWMRLLTQVPGSVLWLKEADEAIRARLRHEAEARNIAADRLVFTSRVPRDIYLAQFLLADLFLDTLPYNAHATASDALAMGLPLLTCRGGTFAGRVAASLLNAAGEPELAADNLSDYETMALKLGMDTPLLQSFRDRLSRNRSHANAENICRHLESAFTRMRDRAERGEPSKSFAV